jgi:hypothetical protein
MPVIIIVLALSFAASDLLAIADVGRGLSATATSVTAREGAF